MLIMSKVECLGIELAADAAAIVDDDVVVGVHVDVDGDVDARADDLEASGDG